MEVVSREELRIAEGEGSAMIGRLLWMLFCRVYGDGTNITPEMLDAIDTAIAEEFAMGPESRAR
jgi:hypothetical protein